MVKRDSNHHQLTLQRSLVQTVLHLYAKLGLPVTTLATRELEKLWGVRVALGFHRFLDRYRGFKEILFTPYLYLRFLRNLFKRSDKQLFQEWIAGCENVGKVSGGEKADLLSVIAVVEDLNSDLFYNFIRSFKENFAKSTELHLLFFSEHKYRQLKSLIQVPFVKVYFGGPTFANLKSAAFASNGKFLLVCEAQGEFSQNFLKHIEQTIEKNPSGKIFFGDEDTMAMSGQRSQPEFRMGWCRDRFWADDFLSHFAIYSADLLKSVLSNQTNLLIKYNLPLCCLENCSDQQISHIPRILFHRFSSQLREQQFSGEERKTREVALKQHFVRLGLDVLVAPADQGPFRIKFNVTKWPKVSCIICNKDKVELLKKLVAGLIYETDYSNLEIIIVDNQSQDPQTHSYLSYLKHSRLAEVVSFDAPFNFSAMNNMAAEIATGDVLAVLNNDLEVINRDWLKEMVSQSLRPDVGAVGAKLFYKNEFIQHAGVIVGIKPVCGHVHRLNHRSSHGYWNQLRFAHSLPAVTAACMVIRKNVFAEVDGFDPDNLAVAYNDVDLCLRLRQLGYRIVWTPHAELYHLESATRPSSAAAGEVNRFAAEIDFMKTKWAQFIDDDPLYNPNLTRTGFDCEPRECL